MLREPRDLAHRRLGPPPWPLPTRGAAYIMYRHAAGSVAGDNAGQIGIILLPEILPDLVASWSIMWYSRTCVAQSYNRRRVYMGQCAHRTCSRPSEMDRNRGKLHQSQAHRPAILGSPVKKSVNVSHLSGLMSADTDGSPVGRPPPDAVANAVCHPPVMRTEPGVRGNLMRGLVQRRCQARRNRRLSFYLPPDLEEKGGVSDRDARQSAAPPSDWAQTRPPPQTRLSSLGSVGIPECVCLVCGVLTMPCRGSRSRRSWLMNSERTGLLTFGCMWEAGDCSGPWWFSSASLSFSLALGPSCFRVSATHGRGNGPRNGSLMIFRR
jgi:hypothetical protein